jgi:hypothetical protein
MKQKTEDDLQQTSSGYPSYRDWWETTYDHAYDPRSDEARLDHMLSGLTLARVSEQPKPPAS